MSVTAQSRDMTDGCHSSSLETGLLQRMPHLGFGILSQTHMDDKDGASLHSSGMDVSDARMQGVDAATQVSPVEGLDATTQTRPMQSVDRTTQTSPMDWNAHREHRSNPVSCLRLLTCLIADMEVEINDLQRHVDRDADSGGGYIFIPQTVTDHSCSMLRRLERMRGLLDRFDDSTER